PARWRLTPSDFWEPGAALRQRLRALERTRHIAGLPRWVYISDSDERSRTALDLESLPALEHIDTLLRHQSSLLVTEMLPAPDALLMGDDTYPSSRVASEIVVRLPADGELAQLAPKIAGRLTLTAP